MNGWLFLKIDKLLFHRVRQGKLTPEGADLVFGVDMFVAEHSMLSAQRWLRKKGWALNPKPRCWHRYEG